MADGQDLEALSQGAAVFIESDYGKYFYERLRLQHLGKHETAEAETTLDSDRVRLMYEAHALREVINMIDQDVALHTNKFFENLRKDEADREKDASIAP